MVWIEYQMTAICRKIDKNNDKPSKFRARKWVEESDNVHGTYKTVNRSNLIPQEWSLCDYSDAYILVKKTITIAGAEVDGAAQERAKK